jgi:hypothetical protein
MDASTAPFCLCESAVRTRSRLTRKRLSELLHYDPLSGEFRWRRRVSRTVFVDDIAGYVDKINGYRYIAVEYRRYPAHQLAWLYMTGEWCRPIVDHRDTDRANNRWDNLRRATKSANAANRVRHRNNSTGFKGVSFNRKSGTWRAQICKDGRSRWLGTFPTPQAAHEAYVAAARRLFGEFARAG